MKPIDKNIILFHNYMIYLWPQEGRKINHHCDAGIIAPK